MAYTTPFESLHKMFGANFSSYHGWSMPADYGDVAVESEKLRSNCAAFDLSSFGKIEITGTGANKLIGLVVVNNINIAVGMWQWGIVCDEKGDLVDLVRVVLIEGLAVILTSPPRREMVASLLNQCVEKHGIADAKINDQTEQLVMLGLYGPNADDVLKKMLPLDIGEFTPGDTKKLALMMINAIIIRGSWVGCDGYEIITNSQVASMAGMLVGRVKESGVVTPAGMECLQAAMVEASLPSSVRCFAQRKKFNTFSLGLGEFVDIEKDSLAKEALKEIKNLGTKLTAMMVKAAGVKKTHDDLDIQYDDGQIGWVGSVVHSVKENCGLGVGLVDSSYSNLTEEVQLVGDGFVAGAELGELNIKETLDGRV